MSIEKALSSLVALGASWVLWLLLALSVLAVAVILERCVFFTRTRLESAIVQAGARASSPAEAEQRMAAEAQLQRLRAEQNLAFLGTLGNNAPFVGLLGTVLGIIGAFHQLNQAKGQLTAGLMAQIGEALIATAVGLMVALPAVAAYNAFQRAIQTRLSRADALGRELIARLHAGEP